jgi:hypothetical protein
MYWVTTAYLEPEEGTASRTQDAKQFIEGLSEPVRWCVDDGVPAHDTGEGIRLDRKRCELAILETDVRMCVASNGEHPFRYVNANDVKTPLCHEGSHASRPATNVGDGTRGTAVDELAEGQQERPVDDPLRL